MNSSSYLELTYKITQNKELFGASYKLGPNLFEILYDREKNKMLLMKNKRTLEDKEIDALPEDQRLCFEQGKRYLFGYAHGVDEEVEVQ